MLINLLQPVLYIIEGLFLSAVVNENDSHGSLVVSLRYSPKPLLPGCIPNLKLHSFLINIDCFDFKVNTYKKQLPTLYQLPIVGI